MTKELEIYRNRNTIFIKFKSLNKYVSNKRKVCPIYFGQYTFFICQYVVNTYSLNSPYQSINIITNLKKDKILSREEISNLLIEYTNTSNKPLYNEFTKYILHLLNLAVYT